MRDWISPAIGLEMKLLKKMDFIFNKMTPKKFIIMILTIVLTLILKDKVPAGFFNAVMAYFGGSAIVSGINNFKK